MNSFKYSGPKPKKQGSKAGLIFGVTLLVIASFVFGLRVDEVNNVYKLFDTQSSVNQDLPEDLDYSSVEEVYDELRKSFDGDLDKEELLNGLKSGLAKASGDPYTVYLNQEQATQFNNDLNGTFTGIGAEISLEDEIITVVSPLDGFPADKAGLRPQDKIIKIDGEDTFGLSVEEAVLKIRGPEGTDVNLTVLRGQEQKEFTITREKIVVPSVTAKIEDNIGYLRISRFAEDTSELAAQAAKEFLEANVDGVVLDLRNNSGGFLTSAVEVASLWLENVPVVQQRQNNGEEVIDTLEAGSSAPLKGLELVVLINEGSASASEIVAGALADYDVATLVGVTSFGKGSVQTLNEFSDGSVLKVTVARWYTPNGNTIDEDGIKPDVKVEISEEDIKNENDPQKDKAFEIIKN